MGEDYNHFDKFLKKLLSSIPGINGVAIVTTEGLPIISVLPRDIDEIRIAAMTAVLLSLAEIASTEMEKGVFEQLYIKGKEGYLIILQVGPNVILILSTTINVKLGLVFLEIKRIFGEFDDDGLATSFPFIPPDKPGGAG